MSRNLTIDVARGSIVLFIPAIHVMMLYSNDFAKGSVLGFILQSFAEGLGAQLLMFVMGFSIVFARKKAPRDILRRSCILFCAAYCLNFLKFILPAVFGLIPVELLTKNGIRSNVFGYIGLFFMGGIFQLAAISYLLCGFLYLWKYSIYTTGIIASCIILFSPLFWDDKSHIIIDLFLRLFNGLPPEEFFPFFPWAAYPLSGLFFGIIFQKSESSAFYTLLFKAGVGIFGLGLVITLFEPLAFNKSFYRLGTGGTLYHIGIVLIWMRICHEMAIRKPHTYFVKLLGYLSRRITAIYIIQGILVCWLLSFFGFNQSDLWGTCCEMIGVSLLTFLMTYFLEIMSRRGTPKLNI